MIYEIKGLCPQCLEETFVLIHNDKIITRCPKCKASPFDFNRIEGVVYVVKNHNQTGVKIGLTRDATKTKRQAVRESIIS